MAEASSSFRLSLPNGASHSSSHDSSDEIDDDEMSSDLLSGSSGNDDNNTDAAQKVMTPVIRSSLDVSAAMATHGSGKCGYGVVGRTKKICDKSYAATIASTTVARPSLPISAATFGSGSKRVVALRDAGGVSGGSGMFRTYDRDYAADKRQKKKKRPLQSLLDRSIEKKKKKMIMDEEDCNRNEDGCNASVNHDHYDQTQVKEFRDSFEYNKSLSRKNRESFEAIARDKEAALHLGSEVIATTAPIRDVRTGNSSLIDCGAGVFEVDDIDARGGHSQSQFSECTLTQAFGGWSSEDRQLERDDDDDDKNDNNENSNVDEDENDNVTDQVRAEKDGNNTGRINVGDDVTLLVVKQNVKGASLHNFSCSPIAAQDSQQTVPLLAGFDNDFNMVEKSLNTGKSTTNETKGVTFEMRTTIVDKKVAIPTNLQPVGAAKRGVLTKKRGRMGGATALALAAECDESRDNDEDKEDDVDEERNSKKRKKRGGVTALALADNEDLASLATTAKLVLAACGSTKNQDRVGSRAFFEHEHVEEGGLPDTSEPDVKPSESFTETEEMQSSEPLLSLSVPLDASFADKKAINEMIRDVRTHYDEMGKALMCPICQSTLKKAIVLPCVHAFCKACLDDYYNPPMPKRERNKKSSPPRKVKKECPVCKTPNSGRRSGEECEDLDQTITSFKTIGRSFSFAPVKYAPGIVMTQLQPTYEDSESEDEDEDEVDKKMSGEKRISHIHEFEEHYQVAKAVQRAFSDPVEEAESQMHTRATVKDDWMINRNRQIAKEQQAVVDADKQFLNREVKRLVEKKQAATTSRNNDIPPSTSNNEIDQSESQVAATNIIELANDLEAKHIVGVTSKALEQVDNRDESIANKSSVENIIGNNHDEEVEDATSTVDEDEFCTAPDDSQVMYDTSIEDSQAASSLNVTIIHDGNTAKKADRPGSSDNFSMRNPRGSVATAATDRSSPIVFHDGNTVKKMSHRQQSNDDDGVSFHNSYSGNDDPAPMRSETIYDLVECTNSYVPTTTVASLRPTEQERIITKGTIVFVQARTWPGINKPGGVARVTKVHAAVDNGGNSIKYDVKYILGGKEPRVDESFITINEVDELSTVEEGLETSMTTAGSMSPEKNRSIRQRKAAMKPEPRSHTAASFPIYNDDELKHIPDDVLRWAGIVPKKRGKLNQGESDISSKHDASKGKKQVLKESNLASLKSAKKLKSSAKALVEGAGKSSAASVKGFSEIISSLSNEELIGLADARYLQLLSLDEKPSFSDTQMTLYAVTSSLSDEESDMLDSLCKLLKGKSGKDWIFESFLLYFPASPNICVPPIIIYYSNFKGYERLQS